MNESWLDALLALGDNRTLLSDLVRPVQSASGVVPFVGAGLSAAYHLPQWGPLLRSLAPDEASIVELNRLLAANEYEAAADYVFDARGAEQFNQLLARALALEIDVEKDTAITKLGLLPTGPIITTNFDRIIETVLVAEGVQLTVVVGDDRAKIIESIQYQTNTLLKLHGAAEDPASRVLTKREYDEHYTRWLRQLLRNMATRPMLFLGCSLQSDRPVKVLQEVVKEGQVLVHHYAVLAFPGEAELDARTHQLVPLIESKAIVVVHGERGVGKTAFALQGLRVTRPSVLHGQAEVRRIGMDHGLGKKGRVAPVAHSRRCLAGNRLPVRRAGARGGQGNDPREADGGSQPHLPVAARQLRDSHRFQRRCVSLRVVAFVRPALHEGLVATSGLEADEFEAALERLMMLYLVKPLRMHDEAGLGAGRRYFVHPFLRDFLEKRRQPTEAATRFERAAEFHVGYVRRRGGTPELEEAEGWRELAAERENILGVLHGCWTNGKQDAVVPLVQLLARWLFVESHWNDLEMWGRRAVEAAIAAEQYHPAGRILCKSVRGANPVQARKRSAPEMRPEYDFRGGVRGKYAKAFARGSNVVVLEPDLVAEFPSARAVNRALRAYLKEKSAHRTA